MHSLCQIRAFGDSTGRHFMGGCRNKRRRMSPPLSVFVSGLCRSVYNLASKIPLNRNGGYKSKPQLSETRCACRIPAPACKLMYLSSRADWSQCDLNGRLNVSHLLLHVVIEIDVGRRPSSFSGG